MNSEHSVPQTSFRGLLGTDIDLRVSGRPEPIPVDLRRSWRVATIILSLFSSRGNRAGHEKLLLLNYALRNPDTQDGFLEVLRGEQSPFFLEVRVDPALARALDFSIGLELVRWSRPGTAELTPAGVEFAEALYADDSLLSAEKAFLERARTLATEGRIRQILRWR